METKQDFIIANNILQKEHSEAQRNLKVISSIKKAINDSRIILYFQPIINNKTLEVEKYESLVRLIDENGNVLAPCKFLDIAKRGKYYSQITFIVLDDAFVALKNTDKSITVNLSALDIEQKATRDKIFALLEKHKEHTSRIIFELLEDENIKDFDTFKNFISRVKEMGVRIAIDDFGAGYSNFERLLDYQPDILKIDGSLVRNIVNDRYSYSVVKTIVSFAKGTRY